MHMFDAETMNTWSRDIGESWGRRERLVSYREFSQKIFKDTHCSSCVIWVPSLKITWHLKMDGWNTSFLLGWPIFRCYVGFRECTLKGVFPALCLLSSNRKIVWRVQCFQLDIDPVHKQMARYPPSIQNFRLFLDSIYLDQFLLVIWLEQQFWS